MDVANLSPGQLDRGRWKNAAVCEGLADDVLLAMQQDTSKAFLLSYPGHDIFYLYNSDGNLPVCAISAQEAQERYTNGTLAEWVETEYAIWIMTRQSS